MKRINQILGWGVVAALTATWGVVAVTVVAYIVMFETPARRPPNWGPPTLVVYNAFHFMSKWALPMTPRQEAKYSAMISEHIAYSRHVFWSDYCAKHDCPGRDELLFQEGMAWHQQKAPCGLNVVACYRGR
jgi:hypothetical protein